MSRITAAERVYQAVLTEIQTESLQPGAALREDLLAKQYGLSRTPVREALRRLVQDGLCEKHGAGLRVSRPTLAQVHEIYPIVSVLEGLASRLCAERLDPDSLVELQRLHTTMEDLCRFEDHAAYVEANQRFHDIILSASGNSNLVSTIQRLRLKTSALRRYQLGIGTRMHQSCSEHALLLKAFHSRDGPGAESAMRQHVDAGHQILVTALSSTTLFEPDLDVPDDSHIANLPRAHDTQDKRPADAGSGQRRQK